MPPLPSVPPEALAPIAEVQGQRRPKPRPTVRQAPVGPAVPGPVDQEPSEVVIEAKTTDASAPGVLIFRDGVRVTYGPTVITADTVAYRAEDETTTEPIEVDLGTQKISLAPGEGYAIGNVVILDPEGEIRASNLRFRSRSRPGDVPVTPVQTKPGEPPVPTWSGEAENIQAKIGAVRIDAQRATITPLLWRLYNVDGTACRENPPTLAGRSSRIDIIPGRRGTIVRPQIRIFGLALPALPVNFGFTLDRRAEGVRLPSLAYDQDRGFGLSFGGNRLPDENSQLVYNFSSFPGTLPSYGASYSRTNLRPDQLQGRLLPVSDLNERFFYSWFTNIYSAEVESEVTYLKRRRDGYGLNSQFNAGATARRDDDPQYTRPLEGILERGGPLFSGGYQAQLRAGAFQENGGDYLPRLSFSGDYAQVVAKRGRFTGIGRLNVGVVASKTLFSYVGGEIGGAYQATPNIRFGGSVFGYGELGRAAFTLDPLAVKSGLSLRADINTAPTKLSLLVRFDGRLQQFDREYRFSQVVGCLEPVVAYREFPRQYEIGLRFRLDDLFSALQQRDPKRRGQKRDPFAR